MWFKAMKLPIWVVVVTNFGLSGCGGSGSASTLPGIDSTEAVTDTVVESATSCVMPQATTTEPLTCPADTSVALEAENEVLRTQIIALQSGTLAVCEDTEPLGDGIGFNGFATCQVVASINTENLSFSEACPLTGETIKNRIDPNMSEKTVRAIVGRPDDFNYFGNNASYTYGASTISFERDSYRVGSTTQYTIYRVRSTAAADEYMCCFYEAHFVNGGSGEGGDEIEDRCRAAANQ